MDEVSGRKPSSGVKQSDHQGNNNQCVQCYQCADSGQIVSAVGFCKDCSDFLCQACIDHHKILRTARHHEVLKGTAIPDQKQVSDEEKCPVHSERRIEVYCPDDDIFGCLLCLRGDAHKSCENITLLSDIPHAIESSKEFKKVQKTADRHALLVEQYTQVIEKYRSLNEEWHSKTLKEFQQFRFKILSTVDKIGLEIAEEADKLKEENEKRLNKLADNIKSLSEQVKYFMVQIEEKKRLKQGKQLVVTLKKSGRQILTCVERMERIYDDLIIKEFQYQTDPTIHDCLTTSCKITTESTKCASLRFTEPTDVSTNSTIQTPSSPATRCISTTELMFTSNSDKRNCAFSGMTELSATQIILADHFNYCLKLIDITSNTIAKRLVLTSQPWDVTKISLSRLAVSLPSERQIKFLTEDLNMIPCSNIRVSGRCLGLRYFSDRLVVSYSKPKATVQILDLLGQVLFSIDGKNLLEVPQYLAVNLAKNVFYVSDHQKNTVTCITTEGVIKWTYIDPQLKRPEGVVAGDDGRLYICSYLNHSIHVVSPDGVKLEVLPQHQTGIYHPQAICYSSYHKTMYVSRCSVEPESNSIHNCITILCLQ